METLIVILLAAIYTGGAWKFWTGFRRTNFSEGRFYLTLLWPLMMFNKSYRQNFNRALKG
jgi:hypothetical protein